MNDASTDNTQAILDGYRDSRLIQLRNTQNLGLTRSLNKGLAAAQGKYIARHDADDVSVKERFAAQVAFLNNHPAVGLLGTAYYLVDSQEHILDTVILPTHNLELQSRLIKNNILCHGTVMMRHELLQMVGGYRPQFLVTQDYDLWLRVAEQSEMATLDTPLYKFRFDEHSISRQKRGLQLAYRNLARQMAVSRRAGVREPAFPADVMQAFPPAPTELFQDMRANGYVHYAAGQEKAAAETLSSAQAMPHQPAEGVPSWEEWALDVALRLAKLREEEAGGVAFIHWLFAVLSLPDAHRLQQRIVGRFYADRAFAAYEDGRAPFPYFRHAIVADKSWLWNRGLWAISAKFLVRR
ncbi:MAG: glycosyltransferase [Anaerolineae bacterium]|nr:glycosyltransferase [Anaerolineae bacterium]